MMWEQSLWQQTIRRAIEQKMIMNVDTSVCECEWICWQFQIIAHELSKVSLNLVPLYLQVLERHTFRLCRRKLGFVPPNAPVTLSRRRPTPTHIEVTHKFLYIFPRVVQQLVIPYIFIYNITTCNRFTMKRVNSETDLSDSENGGKEFHVRKNRLMG